ncbi:hypothetical protein [Mycolicibacterium sp.]|nr:hypothetical protein [Mycolicibacterium sp.]
MTDIAGADFLVEAQLSWSTPAASECGSHQLTMSARCGLGVISRGVN